MQEPGATSHSRVLTCPAPRKFRALAAGAREKIAGKLFGYCLAEGLMRPAKKLAGAIRPEKASEIALRTIVSGTRNVRTTKDLLYAMSVAKEFSAPPHDALTNVLLGAMQFACGTDGVFNPSYAAELKGLVDLEGGIMLTISNTAVTYGWRTELREAIAALDQCPALAAPPNIRAARTIVRWGEGL